MMEFWNNLTFANPGVFGLLVLPVLFVVWQFWRYKDLYPTLRLPILSGLAGHTHPIRGMVKKYLFVLRMLAVTLFIVALARPQHHLQEENIDTEGIDIVMALDISGSMKALDFRPDRLGAAKKTAEEFINNRPTDRIGLVVFAGESFTQAPLTTDHQMLIQLLKRVKEGQLEQGTAIGMGLATSVIRLKDSETESKVVILLTDGVNNRGFIDPMSAVEAAKEYGIRVYTIGVGQDGTAPFKVQTPFGTRTQEQEVELDEELLENIAQSTGGKFYQVTNTRALSEVYQEIDQLEKTRIEVTRITRKSEEFHIFLILGGLLLLLELLLRYTVVRSIP
ncbi:VWA domain-containing protein [Pontibacter sp. G13]|uniref:vWA domain-containing protein n=1 Tax=Pontibacter sp. G13 TaxID=3074898 RepID=UPI002889E59C|nr:VWA domain-containing protein [Pontibacter sp. G13]WNJ19907.1 VWA domain-containing protein [Pontibacter sp. G13]